MNTVASVILTSAIFGLGILFLIFGSIFLTRALMRKKGIYSHSLGLGLLHIQLPRAAQKPDQQNQLAEIREKIGMMDQLFAQLAGIKSGFWHSWFRGQYYFSFELAVPQVGQDVLFYLAVPRRYLTSAEKAVHGVYPEAQIERVEDYTIFHSSGFSAVAVAGGRSSFLPFRTYQAIESDPIGSLLNAFSKVSHQGEGLALQVVCQRVGEKWNQKLSKITTALRQGVDLRRAIRDVGRNTFLEAVKEEAGGGRKTLDSKSEQGSLNSMQNRPAFETLAQLVEQKANKPLFAANLRLIGSAPSQERADALVMDLAGPFSQFATQELNAFSFKTYTGRARQKVIYNYAFRLPDVARRVILSSEELASIVHLPNTAHGASNVVALKAKSAPAPTNIPREGLMLGVNKYRGVETEVRMTEEDRARHFYIIGQTGTGKTYLMRNMILQDIEAGRGVCFIDPHGDMVEDILGCVPASRIKDVIYFNPGDISRPMGLNMLEYDPRYPEQKTFIINELLEIFNKLYDMKTAGGPMFEQYFRNATALVMDDPDSGNTLLEVNRVFVDKQFRDYKLSKTTNPLVLTFWRDVAEKAGGDASLQNIVPYISSKFDSFLSNEIMRPIVTQERSAFRLREIMDGQKILLINLSKGRLGELNSSLIGLIMVGKILLAALSRTDMPEVDRHPFYLYADEFQNVSTSSIETILSEARKYRLSLTIAHQFIGQLEDEIRDAVFGNVGSMASFRVGPADGEFLEKQFAPTFNAQDLLNIDNRHCYIRMLIDGQTTAPFNMRTVQGKTSSLEIAQMAKEYSRLNYGRDRVEVEEETRTKFRALDASGKNAPR